jgi:hypothetical protein
MSASLSGEPINQALRRVSSVSVSHDFGTHRPRVSRPSGHGSKCDPGTPAGPSSLDFSADLTPHFRLMNLSFKIEFARLRMTEVVFCSLSGGPPFARLCRKPPSRSLTGAWTVPPFSRARGSAELRMADGCSFLNLSDDPAAHFA